MNNEIRVHPSSYVDPAGRLLIANNRVLRALNAESAPFYQQLLQNKTVQKMLGRQIVETTIATDVIEGFSAVLEHRSIPFMSYCYEWAPPMLKDAALLHTDIATQLAREGLALQDAYPWNVMFDGPKPVFVDFTSIIKEEKDLLWIAYGQFNQFFLYPLYLISYGLSDVVRSLLHDYVNGISVDQFVRLLPRKAALRKPGLIWQVYLPNFLSNRSQRKSGSSSITKMAAKFTPSRDIRIRFFESLQSKVKHITTDVRSTQWATYYKDISFFENVSLYTAKEKHIENILRTEKPKTVIDIGCNQGGYSFIAVREGASVVAFDNDESSVSMLYLHAKKKNLNILPLIIDVMNPSPAGGWRAEQFEPSHKRFTGEMVFALALVHHLALTQRQSFDRIAATFADYSTKHLVTEFVPLEDEKTKQILRTSRRDVSWYTLDNYITALRKYFPSCHTLPSFPETRTLIICSK